MVLRGRLNEIIGKEPQGGNDVKLTAADFVPLLYRALGDISLILCPTSS